MRRDGDLLREVWGEKGGESASKNQRRNRGHSVGATAGRHGLAGGTHSDVEADCRQTQPCSALQTDPTESREATLGSAGLQLLRGTGERSSPQENVPHTLAARHRLTRTSTPLDDEPAA